MKVKSIIVSIICFLCIGLFSAVAKADTGPKPFVAVELKGIESDSYYVTLLSKYESTGPYSVYDSKYDINCPADQIDIFHKFVSYNDSDGYYFLQFFKECKDNEFRWTYYPPKDFKVLVYDANADTFYVSEKEKTYAFHSYFSCNLENGELTISKSYNYTSEIVTFVFRLILTLLIEIGLAFILKFNKKELIFMIIANIITQVFLNVYLSIIFYNSGMKSLIIQYIFIELLIILIEMAAYILFEMFALKNMDKKKLIRVILYAVIANISSFAFGLAISIFIPKMF